MVTKQQDEVTEDKAVFSTNLKRRMEIIGVSRQDLAEKTGVGVTQIGNFVNKISFPSIPVLKLLAISLECTIDDLVFSPRKK